MGRVEKLVVLGVLFVITVILVVSMNTRDPQGDVLSHQDEPLAGRPDPSERWSPSDAPAASLSVEDRSPRSDRIEREGIALASGESDLQSADEPRRVGIDGSAAVDGEGVGAESGPALLDSGVLPDRRAAALPATIPADWDLVALEGLRRTPDDSILIYTCERDETFESLARRLYGDAEKQGLLQRNNEGRGDPRSGSQVFVPVRDDSAFSGSQYVVQDGDSLWEIAKRVYGKGHRWGEIFDSNSELLPSPEALRAGMVLRIP